MLDAECALRPGEELAGLLLDFSKLFDTMTYEADIPLCEQLGMPDGVATALKAFYGNLQRAFKVRGGIGPWFKSTNGFAQ